MKTNLPNPQFLLRAIPPLCLSALCLLTAIARGASPAELLTLTGNAPGELFGSAVADAGDVNGDGYVDLIVGARTQDATQNVIGPVYVFFGGRSPDSIPDVVLEQPPTGFRGGFGVRVAGAGDVNGDGYDDVMVSAPGAEFSGRVYIYFGGPTMNGEADLTLAGDRTFEFFGLSLDSAGDVNGDGYADVIVGAPWWYSYEAVAPVGRAFIYFGGARPDTIPDVALDSPTPPGRGLEPRFGFSVAGAGDIDLDGYADVIVHQVSVPSILECCYGGAFIYRGGPSMTVAPLQTVKAIPYVALSGRTVASAGDFNADGHADIAVAAPSISSTGASNSPGRVFVYFGPYGAEEDPAPNLTLHGELSDHSFGDAISGGKDLNGDGYSDLLIGDYGNNFDGQRRGRVYVFYGGPLADSLPDAVLNGKLAGSHFGGQVAMGDLNGDGVADALVGAPSIYQSATDPGHVYVYDLSVPLPARAFLRGGSRTIPLAESQSQICIQIEPIQESYRNEDVDLASFRLISPGTGDVGEISSVQSKWTVESDTDGDGVPELTVCFERANLRQLFEGVRGRSAVAVSLGGILKRGRRFSASFPMQVLGPRERADAIASVVPNPMNPQATLTFRQRVAGRVTLRLFEVGGRQVRTIADGVVYPAGTQKILIDGRDARGASLHSGVYFYRLELPDARIQGRLVVAK